VASAKKILDENIDVVTNVIKDYFLKGTEKEFEHIKPGEGRIVEYNGEKSAAYRDEQELLHVVSAKCPHMGCIVHWNSGEKSWDCPCHGSRFSIDGIILEGPAYGDLEKYAIK
jgi:Rieske Fe-S protein